MGEKFKQNDDGSYTLVINRKNRKPLAIGHKSNDNGCGYHDNRPKRKRTRSAQFKAYLKEWE